MSHPNRMGPNSNGMRRSSSSASAGGPFSHQGIAMPRRPNAIPLNRQKISKIRPKLAKFREEHQKFHFESGLDAKESDKFFAQAIRGRNTNSIRRPTARSVSGVTDITNDTEVTGVTMFTFDGKTGVETQEKVKRQLDPLLKARKDLLRSMGTCPDCRLKKVKCSLSHHRLEDLLIDYSDAQSDIEWALIIDNDPKQEERASASSTRRSPTETVPLESFQEENLYDLGAQARDPVDQIDELFPGLGNMDQPTYSSNLVVEGMSDGRNGENDFFPAGTVAQNNCFRAQADFFRPALVPQDLRGTGMQAQYLMGGAYMERPSVPSLPERPTRQRASTNSNIFRQATALMRSQSHLSTTSTPQFNSYNTGHLQQYTHEPQASPTAEFNGAISFTDQNVNAILASCNSQDNSFTCMVPQPMSEEILCGQKYNSFRQLTAHLNDNHRDYSLGSPSPMRHVCVRCWMFFTNGFINCTGCGQQTIQYFCGTQRTAWFQPSSTSSQNLGGGEMDLDSINSMVFDVGRTPSNTWSGGNGVVSPHRNDLNSGNGEFGGNLNGNFNGTFNGSMNVYR